MTPSTYLVLTLSSYFSSNLRAKEARRVYCCYMQKFLRTRDRVESSYGNKVIPNYDGTSTGRPRPNEAVIHRKGREYKEVWPKIEQCAKSSDLSIIELIRSQFEASIDGPPAATSCYGPRAISMAISRRDASRQETHSLLLSYGKVLENETMLFFNLIKSDQLFSDLVNLCVVSSIFKVNSIMDKSLDIKISEHLRHEAERDYLLKPDVYNDSWCSFINPIFKEDCFMSLSRERRNLGINTNLLIL